MIMRLNVSNELKSRLTHAAENGSVIAKDILSEVKKNVCLLYTSPSPRDVEESRMPSSA